MGLYWRGIVHDLSKLLPSEWFPYVDFFYGKKLRGGFTPNYQIRPFNIAWLKHIHRNPHHWQYWILREDDGDTIPLPMPEIYMREMLADWRGARRAITGKDNLVEWYRINHQKMQLHPKTREWLEDRIFMISHNWTDGFTGIKIDTPKYL